MKSGLSARLCVAYSLTSEMRLQLSLSAQWKSDRLFVDQMSNQPREINHCQKEYIGILHSQEQISLIQLNALIAQLQMRICLYCPHIELEMAKIYIFPQVYIC